jgi:hypothetical protein
MPQGIVKIAGDTYTTPGTCWHCGASNTPLRIVRLSTVGVLPLPQDILLSLEEGYFRIPLCASHRHPNWFWHYLRLVTLPLSVLVLTCVVAFMPDHIMTTGSAVLLAVLSGTTVYVTLRTILSRHETFWVHQFNVRTVEVRFNDPSRAARIESELASTANPPAGDRIRGAI